MSKKRQILALVLTFLIAFSLGYLDKDLGMYGCLLIPIIGFVTPLEKWANGRPEPIDETVACPACGSTEDRRETGPGRYQCLCGYEGTFSP